LPGGLSSSHWINVPFPRRTIFVGWNHCKPRRRWIFTLDRESRESANSGIAEMIGKIFFFHNLKAGGSSLRLIIESRFQAEKQCPLIELNKVDHDDLGGDYGRYRGYDLYAGHYGQDIFAAVNDDHSCITNFRHPATRLISLYNFFKFKVKLSDEELRTERYYAVLLAKSVSFERFVSTEDPRVDVYVRNSHFRQLTNSCWSLETMSKVDDVCRFIDRMPWYYVCEYPELSLLWMRRVFNWDVDRMPRENVTGDGNGQATSLSTLDDRTHRIIRMKNNLDLALYRYAVDRFLIRTGPRTRPSGWRATVTSKVHPQHEGG